MIYSRTIPSLTIPFPAVMRLCYLIVDNGIAGVAELVDAADLKSAGAWLRAGSNPAPGIFHDQQTAERKS